MPIIEADGVIAVSTRLAPKDILDMTDEELFAYAKRLQNLYSSKPIRERRPQENDGTTIKRKPQPKPQTFEDDEVL